MSFFSFTFTSTDNIKFSVIAEYKEDVSKPYYIIKQLSSNEDYDIDDLHPNYFREAEKIAKTYSKEYIENNKVNYNITKRHNDWIDFLNKIPQEDLNTIIDDELEAVKKYNRDRSIPYSKEIVYFASATQQPKFYYCSNEMRMQVMLDKLSNLASKTNQ